MTSKTFRTTFEDLNEIHVNYCGRSLQPVSFQANFLEFFVISWLLL
jgi:hypothetical protein